MVGQGSRWSKWRVVNEVVCELCCVSSILAQDRDNGIRSILAMIRFRIPKPVKNIPPFNLRLSIDKDGRAISAFKINGRFGEGVKEQEVVIRSHSGGSVLVQRRPPFHPTVICDLRLSLVAIMHPRKSYGTHIIRLCKPLCCFLDGALIQFRERVHFILRFPHHCFGNTALRRKKLFNEIRSLLFIGKKANSFRSLNIFFKFEFFKDLKVLGGIKHKLGAHSSYFSTLEIVLSHRP